MSTEQRESGDQLRAFLSYSSEDRAQAEKVGDYLTRYLGARVFTADSLSYGEKWRDRLRDELSSSSIFVVLLSSRALDSSWMLQELGAAWALDKPVLSVCTEPDLLMRLPVELDKINCIELKDAEDPAKFKRAVEALLNPPAEAETDADSSAPPDTERKADPA